MYLKELSYLPARGERKSIRGNNKLKTIIRQFYDSTMDYAEVVFNHGEYSSSSSLYSGLKKALDTMEDIPVIAEFIQGGVYLRRVD